MSKSGTVGPYDCVSNQVEMDWRWNDDLDEAEIVEMRFDGTRVELENIAEWVIDSLFQEIPYDKLLKD
tara:strand:- start:60 stop:263 length:204 start_codon:yes stop_codon:yes gene_type:complete